MTKEKVDETMRRTRKGFLERTLKNVQEELADIKGKEFEESAENVVGQCFRFRNSYSLPSKPEDYWWLYMKVLSIERSSLKVWTFEKASDERINIKPSERRMDTLGYEEISLETFQQAWKELVSEINLLTTTNQ